MLAATDERSASEPAITIPGIGDHDAPESMIRIDGRSDQDRPERAIKMGRNHHPGGGTRRG
jgi:hypothetical protein